MGGEPAVGKDGVEREAGPGIQAGGRRARPLETFNKALGAVRHIPGIASSETRLLLATDKA